jgi:hypothetical protein
MEAALCRLAAKAFQSPLFMQEAKTQDNLSETIINQLVAAKKMKKVDLNLLNFLEQCVSSLEWAQRNRRHNWFLEINQVVSDWLENPLGCPDLPVENKDRFPDVAWDGNPKQIGTVEDDRLIQIGIEQGTDAVVVSRDNGVCLTYHSVYLYEIINFCQGEIILE